MVDIKLEGKEIAKSVCDLFSPLTELAGAIGDHIRVYRTLSVLKTLKRAKQIAQEEDLILETPPLKFLVPFLENASLEDENDDLLIELWAKLLVSSSSDFHGEYNLFIRILNELSPDEAKAFKYIANSHIHDNFNGHGTHMEDVSSDWSDSFAYIKIKDLLSEYETKDYKNIDYSDFEQRLKSGHQPPGVYIYFLLVATGNEEQKKYDDWIYDTPRCDFDDMFGPVNISMLISLGLIRDFQSPDYWFDDLTITVYAYMLTPLGASFYDACINSE